MKNLITVNVKNVHYNIIVILLKNSVILVIYLVTNLFILYCYIFLLYVYLHILVLERSNDCIGFTMMFS